MKKETGIAEHQRLKANSFGWAGQFIQSMAHMAPAIGVMFTIPFMASRAGSAVPLATLFATVLAMLLAYCLALLTRKYYGASGYFQIHSRALGSKTGFVTSWLFFIYEPLGPLGTCFGFGVLLLEPFSEAFLGYKIPWWAGLAAVTFVVTAFSLVDAKKLIRITAIFGVIEVVVFLVLGVLLLAKSSDAGFQPQYFLPSSSPEGMGGLFFAFIFGFLMFVGYESGLPLTEETADTTSATFKGLLSSVFLAGLFFTFVSYATVAGFGGGGDPAQFAKDFSNTQNPYGSVLAVKAFGSIGPLLILFAAVNSTLACCLAAQNASARVLFSLGRAGILPAWLGVASPRTKIPARAILATAGITLLAALIFYFVTRGDNLVDWYGMIGILCTLPLLIIHLMTCVSVFVAYRRREGHDFHVIHHGLIPLVTGLLTLLPIWGAVYYNLTPPMSYAPWVVLAWFFVGLGVYAWLKARRPHRLAALESEMNLLAQTPQEAI